MSRARCHVPKGSSVQVNMQPLSHTNCLPRGSWLALITTFMGAALAACTSGCLLQKQSEEQDWVLCNMPHACIARVDLLTASNRPYFSLKVNNCRLIWSLISKTSWIQTLITTHANLLNHPNSHVSEASKSGDTSNLKIQVFVLHSYQGSHGLMLSTSTTKWKSQVIKTPQPRILSPFILICAFIAKINYSVKGNFEILE